MLTNYPDILNQLKKCVRCGQCRSVCPVFEEIRKEQAAPRGRVFLAQMLHYGEIEPSEKVVQHLNSCLMCESCSSDCPSGIPVHKLVALARSHMADKGYLTTKRTIFKDWWTRPTFLKAASTVLWGYQKTGLRSLINGLGLTNLLPGDLPKAEKIIGKVPRRSARSQLPEVSPAKGKKRYRVGYFLGCATDLFYPEIAKATVQVLTENGCEVVIPRELRCCGMPQMANGAYETTLDLARANIETYEQLGVDYIITDCGTCTATIGSHGYAELLNDTPLAEKTRSFAQKVVELATFLTTKIDLLPPTYELGLKVTYHDPCHLSKALKITAQPRNLLKSLPGVQFVEMPKANSCCGGAGTFSLTNYDLSMKILDKKITSLKETGARILATGCPTCTMQLSHGVARHGINCQVMHPIELLAAAYRGKSAKPGKLA